jgi:SAM-dependent methyltransferase
MDKSATDHWNAADYAQHARFVSDLGEPVLDLLAPQRGERLLDLGCGDGALSYKLQQRGCRVIGVDASREMVKAARALGLDARHMDGQALDFEAEFDAVFSNAALHWMPNPQPVIAGVWRALRPGGRFVAEFGGHGNVQIIVAAIQQTLVDWQLPFSSPWYFPGAEEYSRRLVEGGFEVTSMRLFSRPTPLPGDISGWLETFAGSFMTPVDPSRHSEFIARVCERLRPQLCDAQGNWQADYVRLRFQAWRAQADGRTR